MKPAIRLLSFSGMKAVVAQGEACCDAQTHHTGEEQSGFVRADYSVLHIPSCRKHQAFAMGGMAYYKSEAASRLAFDRARADQESQAKNAYDQSRRAKRCDAHKGYRELLKVHEDTKAEAVFCERTLQARLPREAMKKPGSLLLRGGHHPILIFPKSHVFRTKSTGKNV